MIDFCEHINGVLFFLAGLSMLAPGFGYLNIPSAMQVSGALIALAGFRKILITVGKCPLCKLVQNK